MRPMSAETFFDTNILIYGISRNDPRAARATALLQQGGTISVQILNEFTNVALKKLRRTWPEIVEAHRFLESNEQFGKIVATV